MLPTGHVAAGYLTGYALLKFSNSGFTLAQHQQLIFWGMFFGFAPDLDMFFLFFFQAGHQLNEPLRTADRF